jgi:hypothetical protein
MKLAPLSAALSVVAVLVAAPGLARAQVCSSDADCKAGTTCQVNEVPTAKPGCAGPDCPVATDTAIVAPDAVSKACAPAPCQTDADCGGAGMVCHTEVFAACSGGTAAPCATGEKCAAPVPSTTTCTETKVSLCTYKWQLPCNGDTDCGDGFTCAPTVTGMCSGSSGTGTASGGGTSPSGGPTPATGGSSGSGTATDLPAPIGPDGGSPSDPPTCTTTTTFPGYCQAKTTVCVTDADCPAAWSCASQSVVVPASTTTGTPTTSGGSGSAGGTSGVSRPEGGDSAGVPADLVPNVKVCQPPTAFPVRATATDGTGSKQGPGGGTTTTGSDVATPAPTAAESGHASGSGCAIAGASSGAASFFSLAGLALAVGLVLRRFRRR